MSDKKLVEIAYIAGKKAALEKLAFNPALALGIAAPLAVAGGSLLADKGVRRSLTYGGSNKDIKQLDQEAAIPQGAMDTASKIHQELTSRGLDPKMLRMAIDGPAGSGKSTLSKALSQEAGMKHYSLDWVKHKNLKNLMGGGGLEEVLHPPRAGEISEHHLLLRNLDPELYDAAVHIKKSPEEIKSQLMSRGRGAALPKVFNYDKSIGVGDLAFDKLQGDSIDLGNGTFMKVRPRDGWGQEQALDLDLQSKGINPTSLSRHEKLLSEMEGKKTTGSGWKPYVKSPFSGLQTAGILAAIPAGIMAGKLIKGAAAPGYEKPNAFEGLVNSDIPNPPHVKYSPGPLPKDIWSTF